MKFAWFETQRGQRVPVNPARVAWVRPTVAGLTAIVFDGFAGGFHQVEVKASLEEVIAQLEEPPELAPTRTERGARGLAPAAAPQKPPSKRAKPA